MKRLNIKDGRGPKSRHFFRPPPSLSGVLFFVLRNFAMQKVFTDRTALFFRGEEYTLILSDVCVRETSFGGRRWKTGKEQAA